MLNNYTWETSNGINFGGTKSSKASYSSWTQEIGKKLVSSEIHVTEVLSGLKSAPSKSSQGTSIDQEARTSEILSRPPNLHTEGSNDQGLHNGQQKFRIPEQTLRNAMNTSPNCAAHYWQYNMYEGPKGEKVKVHYCKSKETSERVAQSFLNETLLGFDIEWKPQVTAQEGIRKNVSLVQLAAEDRIALFHIGVFAKGDTIEELLAPSLRRIMETSSIMKVGVSVKADCTRLRRILGIDSKGLFELSHLHKLVKYGAKEPKKVNKRLISLAQQVEEHLQLPLWKGEVRSSDWSQALDRQQINYAASDSYAGWQLFHALEAKRLAMNPCPPRPAHAELNVPIRLPDGALICDPSPEEQDEELAEDGDSSEGPTIESMARDFMQIADQAPVILEDEAATRAPRTGKAPEVVRADDWVEAWKARLAASRNCQASPAYLRAYSLWHVQGWTVSECAALLRDPPLQHSTVTSYILEAIRIEKLDYDPPRLKEVVNQIPGHVLENRYKYIKRRLS